MYRDFREFRESQEKQGLKERVETLVLKVKQEVRASMVKQAHKVLLEQMVQLGLKEKMV